MPRPLLALVPALFLLACQKPTPDAAAAAPVAEADSAAGYSPVAGDSTTPIKDTAMIADTTVPEKENPPPAAATPTPIDSAPAK